MKHTANYLPQVKEQYEDYPYPLRDPQDERYSFVFPFTDYCDRVNHYCYGGKQAFGHGFRFLIAGGGTGDSSIYIAEQYGPLGSEIVHLDLSTTSIAIAKERAKIRGIEKYITFLNGSILDLPTLDIGVFDYVNCIGVLHHLADPIAGLAALTSVLKPDGVLAIMLYAYYGRQAIYPLQNALKLTLRNIHSQSEKIRLGRQLFRQLPRSNWYHFSEKVFRSEVDNDQGFYDLLLHSQDRAYTVPELYQFITNAGLENLSFQHHNTSGAYFYDPGRLIAEPLVHKELHKLTLPERQAFTELLAGSIHKHTFYTSRMTLHEPNAQDEDFVPTVDFTKKATLKGMMEAAIQATQSLITYHDPDLKLSTPLRILSTTAALMLAIDNKRTIGEMIGIITSQSDFTHAQVKQEFLCLYEDLRRDDIIYLRYKNIPEFDDLEALQKKTILRMGY